MAGRENKIAAILKGIIQKGSGTAFIPKKYDPDNGIFYPLDG
jgi:hypothetical protein